MREKILNLPKIDLHRHLSGSIRLTTALDILTKYKHKIKVRLKDFSLDNLNIDYLKRFIFLTDPVSGGLRDYVKPFRILSKLFINREEVSRIVFEAAEDAYKDNVIYLELRCSPRGLTKGDIIHADDFYDGILDGIEKAESRYPIIIRIILSVNREMFLNPKISFEYYIHELIYETAIKYRDKFLVGFDLAGIENCLPPTYFRSLFRYANNLNLGATIHVGEFSKKEFIDISISELHPKRLGHALSATNDSSIIERIIQENITIESCITSNIISRAVHSIKDHPIRKFFLSGANIAICTDNPSVHQTSLSDEYFKFINTFGFGLDDLKAVILKSISSAFCDSKIKEKIERIIRDRLKTEGD